MQAKLHQIGVERLQGAFERAAERLDRRARGLGDAGAHVRLRQHGAESGGELARVGDQFGAMRVVERRVDIGKIPDMRAVQDGGAELGGLDRILPAMPDQRAADKNDRRQAIDQAELADRVGDIDVGRGVGEFAARPQLTFSPAARAISATPMPRSGWRGTISVSRLGKVARSR